MLNFIFEEISEKLSEAVKKGYAGGLQSVVALNKKTILKLSDPLFRITYNQTDELLLQNFNLEALTVAGVLNYECEIKLKALALSIINGTHPYVVAHPEADFMVLWQTEAYNIIGDYVEVEDMPPPSQLNVNLKTAVNSSYHAAQYQRLQDLQDVYPAYRYKTRDDARVRLTHIVLHNKVFYAKDPIWDVIWPPNGWNCRCYIQPLSYDELDSVSSADKVTLDNNAARQDLLARAGIDKDFARNSGQSSSIWGKWLKQKFTNMPEDVLAEIRRKVING